MDGYAMFCVCTGIVYFQEANKLAGHATGTAAWATNVGNEHGQVLMSRSDGDGCGTPGSVQDSRTVTTHADVRGPGLLFLRWLQCGGSHVLHVARPSGETGCMALHPALQFGCILEWDAGDLALLREAKKAQLSAKGMSYADVSQHITRKELEKHCRRCTRGTDKTTLLIQALIDVLDSPSGCDTTGMRLFDHERIQDITGYQLYRRTGTVPAVLPDWYGEEGWAAAAHLQMRPRLDVAGEFHRHLVHFVPGGGGGFNDIMIK